jgi:hypothetical protein
MVFKVPLNLPGQWFQNRNLYFCHVYEVFFFSLWICGPLDLGGFFSFLILYIVGRTPWTGDQPVARSLSTHSDTNREETHTEIHASSGIRIHDPSARASEDGSCLRPRGHCGCLSEVMFRILGKRSILWTANSVVHVVKFSPNLLN